MGGAVLVTGASTGIGAATVRRLADDGRRVFGTVRRAEDETAVRETGATPLRLDVTEPGTVEEARRTVDRELDGTPLWGLVNNAGIPAGGPVETMDLDRFRQLLDVNVLGAVRVTKAFLPDLRISNGRIVMMSSISGRISIPYMSAYSASKHALEAVSDSLRRELRPHGVDVVVVEPGAVRTPIWEKGRDADREVWRGTVYEDAMDRFLEYAMRRGREGMEPEVVADAVAGVLESRRPPVRLPVVAGERLRFHLLRLLPDRLVDRLVSP